MTNFDELIDALSETIRMKTKGAELNLPAASQQWEDYYQEKRKALTDAISAVTTERDALLKITDVPEGQESVFYSCDKCGNYLPRVSALERQLKSMKAELAEANEDAERLSNHIRSCCGGNTETCPALELHRARLAKDES